MKLHFTERVLPFLLITTMSLIFLACSDDELAPEPTAGMIKIQEAYALGAATRVELWSKQNLFAGYNQVFFALYDSTTGKRIHEAHIHLHPLMDMQTMTHSCPVEEPESNAVDELFSAGIMFTMPSGDLGNWTLEVNLHNHESGLSGTVLFDIVVENTSPSEIISFQAGNGERFYLSYQFPENLKVGVNEFEVIAFTMKAGEFFPAEHLNFLLTPEMPSMDHGSPNNVNPIHVGAGHYSGKANFTMTGEWRLNLDLMDGTTLLGSKYFDVVVQ